MRITDKNNRVAKQIIEVIAAEKCTVSEANEILSFVNKTIISNAIVQNVAVDESLIG